MPAVREAGSNDAFQFAENSAKVARIMAAAPVSIGDIIVGKYVVERVIGEGGMGIVLAARHRELDQRVAIKFLLAEIAEQGMAAERFRREARSAARMRGAHVCRVLDVGTLDNGVPFMVMEYLEGWDLATELEQRGQIPHEEAVGYVLQACEALAEAHAAGVIHRDLKPANLFLEACADGSRRIKVLDFGVSKSLLDATPGLGALTKTSNLVGSPLYMSPEQLDSAKDVDPRTDIWALGIVLYELIAGRTPFQGESIPQLVTAVLHDAPRKLAELDVDVPAGLEMALGHALSKLRNDRYASVAEFVNALMPYAPPQAAGAAGRVSRLLSLQDPTGPIALGGTSLGPARATPSGTTPTARATPGGKAPASSATPSAALPFALNSAGAVSTPLTWSTHHAGRRKRRVGLSLALLLLLAASAGGMYAWRASSTASVPPPSAKPAPASPPSAPIGNPDTPAAVSTQPPSQLPSAPLGAALPSEPRLVDAGSSVVSATEPPPETRAVPPASATPAAKPVPAAPRPREPERRPEPLRVPKAIVAPVSPAPISDFGGRR